MAYTAEKLATIFGCTVPDLIAINREILLEQCSKQSPLKVLEIVVEMVENLPSDEFGKHLKMNRLWYYCCKNELWKRHKEAEEAYNRAADECKKTLKVHYKALSEIRNENIDKIFEEYDKAHEKGRTKFRCGFVTREPNLGEPSPRRILDWRVFDTEEEWVREIMWYLDIAYLKALDSKFSKESMVET
ncbi:hypothetical protein RhiirA4_479415 [Rhizophagus irregularis]|uniref:Uncharacterized protein n=1 Tax=Rhizophagus irregularis TaxID=588596 RepID=A0A2I1HGE7_9GLOM|nr:hypothetical protein RhiirA4_479415 [Rhizophagus irregularis]